jgi:diguanylate cyclase (GGDEF)-like protein
MNDAPMKAAAISEPWANSRFADLNLDSSSNSVSTFNGRKIISLAKQIYEAGNPRRLQHKLLTLAFMDDLTGLCNRRGLQILAQRQFKLAGSRRRRLLLLFADVDGLKQINDRFGHREGDRALLRVAACFKKTFRGSDVTARISGDEFIALVLEGRRRNTDTIRKRLELNLARMRTANARYVVSLSVGTAIFDPRRACSLNELLSRADEALYEQKRRSRSTLLNSAANSPVFDASATAEFLTSDSTRRGDRLCRESHL